MAIVNVTPDSFYPASRCQTPVTIEASIADAVENGADIIDIGGCSTRPGASVVSLEEEWERVKLGITSARRVSKEIILSVDTFRPEIARRTYEEIGQFLVNDISGCADQGMTLLAAKNALPVVVMHMRGTPETMHSMCGYDDVCSEVFSWLLARAEALEGDGLRRENIILDPGFGFAKTVEQNYALLASLDRLCGNGYEVLVGISRKSMITAPLAISPEDAGPCSQVLMFEALRKGARILRTHDTAQTIKTIQLFEMYDKGC